MTKKTPDKIWAIGINLNGPWHNKPVRMTYHDDLDEWYDKSGNCSVSKLGLDDRRSGITTFASEDKKEVEVFIAGALALAKRVVNVAWIGELKHG